MRTERDVCVWHEVDVIKRRPYVCFWHLADILSGSLNVRLRGQSGHRVTLCESPLLTQRGHRDGAALDHLCRDRQPLGRA